jgi:hypothetical protein
MTQTLYAYMNKKKLMIKKKRTAKENMGQCKSAQRTLYIGFRKAKLNRS